MPDPLVVRAVQAGPLQRAYTSLADGSAMQVPAEQHVQPERPANPAAEAQSASQTAQTAQMAHFVSAQPQVNVGLRFVVDPDSQKLTIYMVDKESKEIIRTIPPSEVNNLKAGDLLTMFA